VPVVKVFGQMSMYVLALSDSHQHQQPPSPIQDNMTTNYNKLYLVKSGDQCGTITTSNSIPISNFYTWNPAVGNTCATLWLNTCVCVGIIGGTATITSKPAAPTGKPIFEDGICGSNGKTCAGSKFGSCCSKYNFSGSGLDYCSVSNGFQTEFGSCQAVTEDSICGFNGRTCLGGKFGTYCGKNYLCGSGTDSCSVSGSCLSAFGTYQAVTQDVICRFNGRTCIGGQFGNCCSKNYYCSSSTDYCAVKNCLPIFGNCNSS